MAAYNEETVIAKHIEAIFADLDADIVVVDDGSSDTTLAELRKIQKRFSRLIVLHHSQNLGQGAAIETGFEYIRRYGRADLVTTFDADGQHSIADVKKMQNFLEKHPKIDMLLGSRFLENNYENMPWFRKMILKGGIIFTGIISGIWLTDAHNGLRMMRRKVLDDIKITLDGMGHASEIVDIVANKKIAFQEIPVRIEYSEYSLSKGQSSMNSLRIAMRVIYKKFF